MSTDPATTEQPSEPPQASASAHSQPEASSQPPQPVDNALADGPSPEQELSDMKLVVLESAELANRSANMATNAGADLKTATKSIHDTVKGQKRFNLIMASITGALLVFGALVFGSMTFTLKTRINQIDEMLSAMSKRVGELNDGLEVVGSVNEGFQEMVAKQEGIAAAQTRLEVRINEFVQSAQAVPDQKAKQTEARDQAVAKQVQALESGLRAQSQAINALSAQMQGLNRSMSDNSGLKREMQALAKLQRERQQAEASLLAQVNKAKAAAEAAPPPQAAKPRDRLVRYPRVDTDTAPTPGAGVLSTK